MDNSAFEFEEQGHGVSLDLVYDAAMKINPDEVCAIDVLFNGSDTVDSVKDFLKFWKRRNPLGFENTKFMAIPQGRSEDEWMKCYEELIRIDDVDVIGFSKLAVPESFIGNHHESGNCSSGRIKCLNALVSAKMTPDIFNKELHLLGSDNVGVNELMYYYDNGWDFIRSNDTSMPFVYGYNGSSIQDGYVDEIIMEKLNFDKKLNQKEIETVDHNFLVWKTIHLENK
jgi:hypothetical protein